MRRLLVYLANLTTGRIILWCYAIWYVVNVWNHFDTNPRLWLTSLGLSGIIGLALAPSIEVQPGGRVLLGLREAAVAGAALGLAAGAIIAMARHRSS